METEGHVWKMLENKRKTLETNVLFWKQLEQNMIFGNVQNFQENLDNFGKTKSEFWKVLETNGDFWKKMEKSGRQCKILDLFENEWRILEKQSKYKNKSKTKQKIVVAILNKNIWGT